MIPGEKDTPFENLPRGKSAEWYLANMPSPPKKEKQPGGAGGSDGQQSEEPGGPGQSGNQDGDEENDGLGETLDDHSGWGDCPQEVKDMARERLKDIVKKAAEDCARNNSWGSVSSQCKQDIMKVFESKIDWRKVLRYFVRTSQRANKSSSIKRINRRYPYIHSGRKTNRVAKVAISIDQSGSVDNDMLASFR